MARATTQFVCQQCGAAYKKWAGRCDACGEWNSISEEALPEPLPKGLGGGKKGRKIDFVGLQGAEAPIPRRVSGIAEFDRVCGGGLVSGSALLVGGDPGIGKSTLLLQAVGQLAARHSCAYVSGEEAVDQVRLRAKRLGLEGAKVGLASATNVRDICATFDDKDAPEVVVIDSIQTMYVDNLDSAPGTVAQVRTSAQELIRLAKRRGFCVILVGHVTKEGQIAGPRILEHMVDTVLYFEGDRGHQFRILRAVKNRFGATDEIGVFEMTEKGLAEIPNPSALFLADHRNDVSGSTVFAGMEGSRPMLVEIQSLLAPSPFGSPRRSVVGWDGNRLSMIMAVLEARCGIALGDNDVYLNVAGGLRISEPAADLAVAASLISALNNIPMPGQTVAFGEVGLSGEVRPVGQTDARLKEAGKLGFKRAIIPVAASSEKGKRKGLVASGLDVLEIRHLNDLVGIFRDLAAGGDGTAAKRA